MFRGSQYKVESFIFRLAKPESFVLVSPSKQQVGLQNAPFAVPLIAEPESKYYNHPIIVLDFQSLYPSVMIAYNLCYSTCLGRVEKFKGTDKFGFTELKVADGLLELLKDYLTGESGFRLVATGADLQSHPMGWYSSSQQSGRACWQRCWGRSWIRG